MAEGFGVGIVNRLVGGGVNRPPNFEVSESGSFLSGDLPRDGGHASEHQASAG